MAERRERWLDRATRLLVLATVLVVLLNGLPFWARRVGLIDRPAYQRELALFCRPPLRHWWLPASCRPHRLAVRGSTIRRERIDFLRLYRLAPREVGWKAARHAVLPLLLIGSIGLLLAGWQSLPPPRVLLPLVPLLLSTLSSLWISLSLDGAVATALGALSTPWIPLAALAGWLTTPRRLRILADGAAALVLLQVPFLMVEAMRGLPLPFGGPVTPWLPTRLSGLMNQPNTLGALLAISVALCVSVSPRRWQRGPLLLLSLLMAALARSGSGVVGLLLLAAVLVHRRLQRRWRIAVVAALLIAVAALPQLLGRPQLFQSPSGRWRTLWVWMQLPRGPQERWLGHGLADHARSQRSGQGWAAPSIAPSFVPVRQRRGPAADGQPLLLLSQGGVVALVAFYGLLAWCCWHDPPLRPFWAVLLLTSLTINLTEVFPLVLWLAILTSRSLARAIRPAGPRG